VRPVRRVQSERKGRKVCRAWLAQRVPRARPERRVRKVCKVSLA
jgi:hypothetical protein